MNIVISGKARAGKDTFGAMLSEHMYELYGRQFIMMAYAYEIKIRVQKDFDLSWEQLWGNEKEIIDKRYPKPDGVGFWTPREILQSYGQFFRTIDNDFWVNNLFGIAAEKNYENIIITDARHPNEVLPIINKGGYHIRIFRNDKDNINNETHISEIALDDGAIKIDFRIDNNGSLKDLSEIAADVVKSINTIEHLHSNINKRGN